MSTKEWADYQRQVARERMQKWRARAAATAATTPAEEVSSDDAEEEEVRRDVGGSSSLHDKYIYSMNAAVKPKLSKWMDWAQWMNQHTSNRRSPPDHLGIRKGLRSRLITSIGDLS